MARLTEKEKDEIYKIQAENLEYHSISENSTGDVTYRGEHVDKLAKYENAEEQELLIKLPCKIGDAIYKPVDYFYEGVKKVKEPCIFEFKIRSITINSSDITFSTETDYGGSGEDFKIEDIGKTIFLKEKDAKKTLGNGDSMKMYTVYDIANWFLSNLENITNKKLQKLVYYAYSWYIAFYNESADNIKRRFFENKFEAWVHGAMYPELYAMYKKYGSDVIPSYKGNLPKFSEDDLDVLNQVLEVYGRFTGIELESICNQEEPWKNARKNLPAYEASHELISDEAIFNYYSTRLNDD